MPEDMDESMIGRSVLWMREAVRPVYSSWRSFPAAIMMKVMKKTGGKRVGTLDQWLTQDVTPERLLLG